MTQIKVALRLHPFSHRPGVMIPVPGTDDAVQIYPTKIEIYSLRSLYPLKERELFLSLTGPVRNFSTFLNLEKGQITVSGRSNEGYFRLLIGSTDQQEVGVAVLKSFTSPEELVEGIAVVDREEILSFLFKERLSLGCSKKQDWDLVTRRGSLQEVLPFWLRLGLFYQNYGEASLPLEGTFHFLHQLQSTVKERNREGVEAVLEKIDQTSFFGMLTPSLVDRFYQGIDYPPLTHCDLSPLAMVASLTTTVRSMFLSVEGERVNILPSIPPRFFCGRYLQIPCASLGTVDLDWTKKKLRRMVFYPEKSSKLQFQFPREIRSFRVKCSKKERGEVYRSGDSLVFQEGTVYYFDRFEK